MAKIVVNDQSFDDIKLVLFDKDGTLIDIHHYWATMIRLRANLLEERYCNGANKKIKNELINLMGVDLSSGRMKPDGPVGVKPRDFIVNIATSFLVKNKIDVCNDDVEAAFKEVDKFTEINMLPLLNILPNIRELLKSLKNCRIKTAVVSTDITHRAVAAMEQLDLHGFFDIIIGGDAVEKTKPSADLALYAMNKLDIPASQVLMIGDHPVDMQMAKSAGIFSNIGVLTGMSDRDTLSAKNVEIVDNLGFVKIEC